MLFVKLALMLMLGISSFTFGYSLTKADTLAVPDTSVVKSDTGSVKENDSNESIAEDFSNRLKSQLNLTDEQTKEVKSIISSYAESKFSGEDSNGEGNSRIERLLNDTQKGSWQSVKQGFWSDLDHRIKDEKK